AVAAGPRRVDADVVELHVHDHRAAAVEQLQLQVVASDQVIVGVTARSPAHGVGAVGVVGKVRIERDAEPVVLVAARGLVQVFDGGRRRAGRGGAGAGAVKAD